MTQKKTFLKIFGLTVKNILPPSLWYVNARREVIFMRIKASKLLAAVLASRLSKGMIQPILNLDLEHPEQCETYDELSPLLTRIRRQNDTIQRQMEIYETILRYEKNGRDQVVICGAYGRGNAGDDAILLAILRELRSINPDLSCQVFSRNPIDTRRTYRVNAFYTFNFWKAVHCFKQAKFFINGGGSLMQDVTSYRSLWFYLWTLAAAKRHGCPVIMYGCGIGPIQYPSNRKLCARVLQSNVDMITLRDTHSLTELEDMGIHNPEIVLSSDLRGFFLSYRQRKQLEARQSHRELQPLSLHGCPRAAHSSGYVYQAPAENLRVHWISEGISPAHPSPLLCDLPAPLRRGQADGGGSGGPCGHWLSGAHLLPSADAAQAGRRETHEQ